uniref:Coat protein n=1 Tax=Erysiphales associated totivirus 11 TaxID=2719841 RepID=A0A6G9ELK0_9VIRU|nr:coat protein [Erysiphales associated totivirus 11]
MGITIADMIEEGWVKAVQDWLANQPDAYTVDAIGSKIVNYSCGHEQLGFPVTYFECHKYDDGNSKSGKTFMSECGFRNGRYKLPKSATHLVKRDTKLYKGRYFSATGGDEAARIMKDRGHINCSGLSQTEYGILNNVLCNTQRRSPLLCDQEINFNLGNNTIAAYNGPEVVYDEEEVEVTHMNVVRLIQKLVQNHRWYEGLRDAMIMSSYWLMQPSTETVESHWWVCLKRRMLLPQMGLTRAIIPQLVSITATNVSREGLEAVKAVGRMDDSLLIESLYKNTCWYWGEYLAIYSAKDMDTLLDKMYKTADDNLNIQARYIALVSAVTGKHVATTNTGTMYVMIEGGIKAQLRRTVSFGKINIPNIEEYGYAINAEKVIANSLVAPGCVGLILGMGGDLIKYTPYGNAFGINQAVRMRKTSGYQEGYSWYDLWALCVVADWQGYDVIYTTPGNSKKLFKSYSPGECSVAVPPVRFSSDWDYGKYVVKGVVERDVCHGSNAVDVHRAKRSFVWTRTSCKVQHITEYGSIDAPSEELEVVPIDDYIMIEKQRDNYMAYVLTTYNMDESDFCVEYTRTAIPVHTGIPVLESTNTEDEQPPVE